MPTCPLIATDAPSLRVAGLLWITRLAAASGLEGMPAGLDSGADEAARAVTADETAGGALWRESGVSSQSCEPP